MKNGKLYATVKRVSSFLGKILIIIICTASVLLCQSIKWMFDTWPYLSIDELMYQLRAPMDGTSRGMIKDYIISCVPLTVLVFLFVTGTILFLRKRKKIYYSLISLDILVSVVVTGCLVYMTWNRLDIMAYAQNNNTYSNFIDTYYVDPDNVDITFPEEKRNLIYIYLESMEVTYADETNGGIFEKNYIPELTEMAQEYEDFSGIDKVLEGGISLSGTTWTMGALFAHTSGLPLSIPIDGNSMDTQESFFPGLTTLGDVLEEQGYNQIFIMGSDANFGGRELYFEEHGNYDIKDYYYYRDEGKFDEDYWVWWGFEDNRLFEYAKEELNRLSASEEPFSLTMLTVDTHFEDGYECEVCPSDYGDDSYANVIACSSRQVSDFIKWVQQQEFYDNTTIIITGDHPTMDTDFCENTPDEYERKVYTAYINSAVEPDDPQWRRSYSTLDSFPTTLASLGAVIEGNRLGLGTNLFSAELTLLEKYQVNKLNEELQKRSELMDSLSDSIDLNSEKLMEREGRNPSADIQMVQSDQEERIIDISISNIENINGEIEKIMVAVWEGEKQTELSWYEAEVQADGSFIVNASVSLDEQERVYHANVYCTDQTGVSYSVGSASITVRL